MVNLAHWFIEKWREDLLHREKKKDESIRVQIAHERMEVNTAMTIKRRAIYLHSTVHLYSRGPHVMRAKII